jgi:hypothetical protein
VAADTSSPSGAVTYSDGKTPVLPGDRVSVRLFFRRRAGEVIYVPGISKRRGTYEHNGLTWVGVSLADGWAIGEIVLPDSQRLKPSVRFLGRGNESLEGSEALHRIGEQEREEDRLEAAEEVRRRTPAPPPKPLDWVAAAASMTLQLGMYLLAALLIGGVVLLVRRLF